jgi:hypothetical protein
MLSRKKSFSTRSRLRGDCERERLEHSRAIVQNPFSLGRLKFSLGRSTTVVELAALQYGKDLIAQLGDCFRALAIALSLHDA